MASAPLALGWVLLAGSCLGVACKGESSQVEPQAAPKPTSSDLDAGWYDETRPLYNKIPVTVRFEPRNRESAVAVWRYLESIDDTFNSYRRDSEVGRLNQRADVASPVLISNDMATAIAFSKQLHADTGGAFDITVAPLVQLWGRAAQTNRLPSDDDIAQARGFVGLDAVRLEGDASKSLVIDAGGKPRAFDFGGVIKGLAADRAAAMLREAGATSVFVQVGNETVAFGPSPRGRPTILAIPDPRGGDISFATIADPGTGLSATTSSNNKQPRVIEGVTHYHIVDPRTGRPVSTKTLSVTVAFATPDKAGLADGLATAIPVLGPERGLDIVRAAGGEALVLLEGADTIERHQTPGFQALLVK